VSADTDINSHQNPLNEVITVAAHPPPVLHAPSHNYWDSTDAKKLFGANLDDENTLKTLEQKIELLKAGNQTVEGYQSLIDGRDPHDLCMPNQVYEIRQRCAILRAVYIFAKEQMGNHISWDSCCSQSCLQLNKYGLEQTTDSQVVQRWNIAFRSKECFKHPNPHVVHGKVPELLIFEAFLSIKCHICKFCLHDLANLTIEKVHDHVLSKSIPKCMHKDGICEEDKQAFLEQYGLKTVLYPTVYCWMTNVLGFAYCD